MSETVVLHHWWDSEESHRVRLALAVKEVAYQSRLVSLPAREDRGEAYRALSPQGLFPTLEIDGAAVFGANPIIEYLEETHPSPFLLPAIAAERARVRAFAEIIATEISPICAPRVVDHVAWLTPELEDSKGDWLRKWFVRGLSTLEAMLDSPHVGAFAHGDEPSLADCHLIPLLRVARRWGAPVWRFPRITAIELGCASHPAFVAARPERWAPPEDAPQP